MRPTRARNYYVSLSGAATSKRHGIQRANLPHDLVEKPSLETGREIVMQLIEMIISAGHVQLLYANATTKDEASEWLEFRVHSPARGNQRLGVIQQTALHRVRELIDAESERFAALSAQLRE